MRNGKMSSIRLIPLSFLGAIALGTLLLLLPFATAKDRHTDFITALFTATTSVCVTGLVVVDTFSHWSLFGQTVILLLIQIGGLGIITVASLFMVLSHRKFSLGDRIMLKDALNLNTSTGVLTMLRRITRGTLIVEAVGMLLYLPVFIRDFGPMKGLWVSAFNAVSAFCNAGMDVIGPSSLALYRSNPLVMGVTMTLIVLGGLGFVVWFDVNRTVRDGIRRRFTPLQIAKRFNEHTKLVLCMTGILILGGAVLIFVFEYGNPSTIGNMPLGGKIVNSLFQSITLRTAGFTTFSQKGLTGPSCLAAFMMMFIGGSPIGTAGGVKTVTFYLALMHVITYIRGQDKVLFRHAVSGEDMRKASVLLFVSLAAVLVLAVLLIACNPVNMTDALYEVISASATVGLSRNLTPRLNFPGKLVIIFAMYLGRIGPISMAVFFARRRQKDTAVQYTEGKFFIG